MQKSINITNAPYLDNLFIFFPFWIPLFYISLITFFPTSATIIFIGILFILAETHFGISFFFLFDKNNHKWIKNNSYKIIFLPVYLLIVAIGIWFFNPQIVILIHYLSSGWHVTRQSIGILKIRTSETRFNSFLIYLISGGCLFIGLFEPGIFALVSSEFSTLLIAFVMSTYILLIYISENYLKNFFNKLFPLITGISIYVPILFFKDLTTATAIGVGMHWFQYLSLMWIIDIRKSRFQNTQNIALHKKRNFTNRKILFLVLYSLLMTMLTSFGTSSINSEKGISFLYLIPILFHFFHFYLDGFIWKFSDPHIKKVMAGNLFKSANN